MDIESQQRGSTTSEAGPVSLTAPIQLGPEQQYLAFVSAVELSVRGLSVSLLPKPSVIASLARSIQNGFHRLSTHLQQHQPHPAPSTSPQITGTSASPRAGLSIFRNISLNVKPGQVCLILGGSASGKTTLLNTLAGQTNLENVALSGTIKFNGQHPAPLFWHTRRIGYLGGQDHLNALLTPRETLECIANLHDGTVAVTEDTQWRIEQLLSDLGLQGCADRRIGTPGAVGSLRSGEMRRLSLAIQLLATPSLLFCHEPTNGLDAHSSYQLLEKLKDVAQLHQIAVITTLHQPQSDMFPLMVESKAQLVLLSSGNLVYSGPLTRALSWFESIEGIGPCPGGMNPFEHMAGIGTIDYSSDESELATMKRHERLVQEWALRSNTWTLEKERAGEQVADEISADSNPGPLTSSSSVMPAIPPFKDGSSSRRGRWCLTSLWKATTQGACHTIVLTQRAWLCQRRTLWQIFWIVLLSAVFGAWLGYLFSSLSGLAIDIHSRFALLFTMATIQPLAYLLLAIHRGTSDIRVFDWERASRFYGPWPFLASWILQSLPAALLSVVSYATIVYFVAHLRTDSIVYYFYNMLALCILQILLCFMALFFCSIFRGFLPTALVCITFYSDYFISAGYYVTADRIPRYYDQMPKVSPFALVFRILSSLEFSDRTFECPFELHGDPPNPFRCHQYNGNIILDHHGHTQPHYYPASIAYLLIHCATFMLLTWIVLTWNVVAPNAPSNPGNFLDLVFQFTHGLFIGSDPKIQHPLHLRNPRLARSSATVDQLRHTLVSTSNRISPPSCQPVFANDDNAIVVSPPCTAARSEEAVTSPVTTVDTIIASDPLFPAAASSVDPSVMEKTLSYGRASSSSSIPQVSEALRSPPEEEQEEHNPDNQEARGREHCIHIGNTTSTTATTMAAQNHPNEPMTGSRGVQQVDQQPLLPRPRDPVEIRIDRLGLYATVPHWELNLDSGVWYKPLARRKERFRILHDLTATFPPGQLTGILGGRGTGKTALLQVILSRLSSSSFSFSSSTTTTTTNCPFGIPLPKMATTLTVHGDVYFNASRNPCLAKLDAVCGYVAKDDSFLLAHLSVRETLAYAVALHLTSRRHRQRRRHYRRHHRHAQQGQQEQQQHWPTLAQEQHERVETLLALAGLVDCAETMVGGQETYGSSKRGRPAGSSSSGSNSTGAGRGGTCCTPGQRRRLVIALQLIGEPACLVLDEPTTGLDDEAAAGVMRLLQAVAGTGRTVISTLQRPGLRVWQALDSVVLMMHGGRLGYAGKASGILQFFAAAHLVLPAHTNPADFVVEKTLINYQSPHDEMETRRRIEQLAQFFTEYRMHMPSPYYPEDEEDEEEQDFQAESSGQDGEPRLHDPGHLASASSNYRHQPNRGYPRGRQGRARARRQKLRRRTPQYASCLQATPILTRRSWVNTWRQKGLFLNRILAPCIGSLMVDLYFTHVDKTPAGMTERFAFIQLQLLMGWYGAFVAENRFSVEKGLAYHEISNGAYGASSFLLAYTLNELPMTLVSSGLATLLAYVVVPFQWTWLSAGLLWGSMSILIMAGESMRMLMSTWISHSVGVSFSVTLMVITLMNQMAGLYKHRLPLWLIRVNFLNVWWYTTEEMARGIFPGVRVECTRQQELELRCLIRNGESWMAFLRLNRFSIAECLIGMIGLAIFYRILVWVSLLIKTSRQRG